MASEVDLYEIAQRRIASLRKELAAWTVIAETERPGRSQTSDQVISQPELLLTKGQAVGYGTKIAAVRRILQEVGELGITPKELADRLGKTGVDSSSGFASNALFRMKARNQVVVVNGRYMLAGYAKSDIREFMINSLIARFGEVDEGDSEDP